MTGKAFFMPASLCYPKFLPLQRSGMLRAGAELAITQFRHPPDPTRSDNWVKGLSLASTSDQISSVFFKLRTLFLPLVAREPTG
jgi:hypothetical protein